MWHLRSSFRFGLFCPRSLIAACLCAADACLCEFNRKSWMEFFSLWRHTIWCFCVCAFYSIRIWLTCSLSPLLNMSMWALSLFLSKLMKYANNLRSLRILFVSYFHFVWHFIFPIACRILTSLLFITSSLMRTSHFSRLSLIRRCCRRHSPFITCLSPSHRVYIYRQSNGVLVSFISFLPWT